AGNDIEVATDIARSMVCEWGMSDRLGPLAFGKKQGEVFLGKEMGYAQDYSEQTARDIDEEVRRIVTEQDQVARKIPEDNFDPLMAIADALMEHETLEGPDLDVIISGGTLQKPKPPPAAPSGAPAKEKERKTPVLGALEGIGKLEPGKA